MRTVFFGSVQTVVICFIGLNAHHSVAQLQVGDKAPVLRGIYSDADTAAVRPWDFSGRFTLLVFWWPDSPGSAELLAELRRIHRDFAAVRQFQIVGVAAPPRSATDDDVWNRWVEFIGQQPDVAGPKGKQAFRSAWPQLFEAERFDPRSFPPDGEGRTSAGRYGVSRLPTAFLVSPEGRLAAVQIAPEKLHATVAIAVKKPARSGPEWQQLFDLSARRTKLLLELDYVEKKLAELEKKQLAGFVCVATPTGSDYWESISDTVLFAKASQHIRAGELLLYHPPGIYRVNDEPPVLTTEGECWYFLTDREILSREEFTVVPDYEAHRTGKNVAPHPGSDPQNPYRVEIRISGRAGGK